MPFVEIIEWFFDLFQEKFLDLNQKLINYFEGLNSFEEMNKIMVNDL